jgi:hypothetical protein
MASAFAKAESIDFKANGFYYKLKTSQEEISLKGYLLELYFHKKECNENLINSLHDKITKSLRNKVLVEKDYYLLSLDGNEYKIAKSSDLGKFLYNFPNMAKKNKEKEAFLCRRKNK